MDIELACLTIGAPGELESIFHSTEGESNDRSAAVSAAYAGLPNEIADLKRQLKNLLKADGSNLGKLLTLTSESPLEMAAASKEVVTFFTVQGKLPACIRFA
jgi:hypothetical protein